MAFPPPSFPSPGRWTTSRRGPTVETAGAGLCLNRLDPDTIRAAVTRLLDPAEAAAFRVNGMALIPDSGAERAAQALLRLLPNP